MEVIMGYFRDSKVDVVTLYGQAGFGKSEIALHVGHKMLELGLDVHYIKVENFVDVESLERVLLKISSTPSTIRKLVNWAQGLTKKTLLILDNVDGPFWINNTSRQKFKKLFLNPLLDNTFHLLVLITSQQEMQTKYVYRSYHLHSLSTKDCVSLIDKQNVINKESESNICNLVGNVPFAINVLAKALSSGTSAGYNYYTETE